MRIVLLFVTLTMLAACGRAEPAAPVPAEASANAVSDAAEALSNEAGRLASAVEEAATLPPYLPMPAGGQINLLTDANGLITANITAPGRSAEALESYETAMRAAGLEPRRRTISAESGMLFADAKGRSIQVTVTRGPAGNSLFGIVDRPATPRP